MNRESDTEVWKAVLSEARLVHVNTSAVLRVRARRVWLTHPGPELTRSVCDPSGPVGSWWAASPAKVVAAFPSH